MSKLHHSDMGGFHHTLPWVPYVTVSIRTPLGTIIMVRKQEADKYRRIKNICLRGLELIGLMLN